MYLHYFKVTKQKDGEEMMNSGNDDSFMYVESVSDLPIKPI